MQYWHHCGVSLSTTARWLLPRQFFTKLFVGGLSYDTNETILRDAFRQHGELIEEGYGFVKFTSESAASKALKEMNGQLLDGRNIRVCYAHRR
ncbi:glycine-rich RNA-binding protein 2, mitochondrial isoform X2 [Ricinus communis]|uniref:glycine-rich RNA-binding protein 2, mitochondrial isoform X2 n=1 Tax=Ricinus communis TaxID=3988 RepID=UPI000D68F0CD|nr:glycine-rich RNA-binding protein 2, mitochondrial isoform X2 [Ricinus communis]|eukprot:XP_025015554.1 glycine-rich RNA-binding protein 2, mitochondrial isoform X2 [Ricinus communis]